MSSTRTQVGIVEWVQRCASARTIELQLAAKLGSWIPRVQPAAAKLLLARHARHHAGHVELWDAVVPLLHDHAADPRITVPTLSEAQAVLVATDQPVDVYDEVDALVVATYRAWSEEATPVAERPVMRVLDLVLRDLDFDAQEGHDLFSAGR